jgi:hypothetical protein
MFNKKTRLESGSYRVQPLIVSNALADMVLPGKLRLISNDLKYFTVSLLLITLIILYNSSTDQLPRNFFTAK